MQNKIVLIGPPGAGKSSVGRALSKEMGLPFADSDNEIEQKIGKKISEIFVDDGEVAFRKIEVDIVTNLLRDFNGVIALGGGAPITAAIQKILESSDYPIVFIDVSISQAANRVGFNKDRPLLLINPRQQWQALMSVRRPTYEGLATEIISSDNKKPLEVAKEIIDRLKSRL